VESSLFIESWYDGGHLGHRYLAQTLRVLERYAPQSADDGEADFASLGPLLWERHDWPQQAVSFVAHDAHTAWGETIRVVGGHKVLGWWGQEGLGVPLGTDAGSYPSWAGGEVALPLGTVVPWKLVAEEQGALRWEAGDDRALFVAPAAFAPDAPTASEATWR
jgi:hypothetical protein